MAAHEEAVLNIVEAIRIITAALVGEILYAWGLYKSQHTAQVAAQKALNALADLGRITKLGQRGGYFYRAIGCRSEWGEHARLLSTDLVKIKAKYPEARIIREADTPVNRRSDALVLLVHNGQAAAFFFERLNTERPSMYAAKQSELRAWDGAAAFLSEKFGVIVPHFSVLSNEQLDKIMED